MYVHYLSCNTYENDLRNANFVQPETTLRQARSQAIHQRHKRPRSPIELFVAEKKHDPAITFERKTHFLYLNVKLIAIKTLLSLLTFLSLATNRILIYNNF